MSGPHTLLDPLGIGGGRHSLLDPAGIFGNRGSSGGDHLAGIEIQTSCYGGVLPLVYGTTRIAGNLDVRRTVDGHAGTRNARRDFEAGVQRPAAGMPLGVEPDLAAMLGEKPIAP